jgi:TetR/AcrR family transcriptional regulator of autoinduction and epiphytic fitness
VAISVSDKKRAAILQAALESFRRDGFHATTMDGIAERAGVSKRTVYNHFPSKDELFDVVIQTLWNELVPLHEQLPDGEASVEARLRDIGERRLQVLLKLDVVGLFRVLLAESMRTPELARAYGPDERRAFMGLGPLLRDEIARGRLQVEHLELAAAQFWGLVLNPLFWPHVLGLRASPEQRERQLVVNEAVAVFMARYGAPPRNP